MNRSDKASSDLSLFFEDMMDEDSDYRGFYQDFQHIAVLSLRQLRRIHFSVPVGTSLLADRDQSGD